LRGPILTPQNEETMYRIVHCTTIDSTVVLAILTTVTNVSIKP